MTYEEFTRELARGEFRPAYCFYGEEWFLVQEGARQLIAALLPGPERSFSLVELGAEAGPEEIRRALSSPSFFGGKRVIRLRGLERFGAEALEALIAGIKRLPPGTFFIALGRPDGRLKAAKDFLAAVSTVECPAKKKGEALAWARTRAEALGLTPAAEIAAAVVEAVGTSLGLIVGELEKLATYLGGEKRPLTQGELSSLLGRVPEEDVFKLVEAAADGRVEEALRILADLFTRGEPEGVLLALLERQLRQILLAGELLRAGRRGEEVAATLGVPRFVAERLMARANRFPPARCRSLLGRMLRADLRSKSSEGDPRWELESIVLAMAGKIG